MSFAEKTHQVHWFITNAFMDDKNFFYGSFEHRATPKSIESRFRMVFYDLSKEDYKNTVSNLLNKENIHHTIVPGETENSFFVEFPETRIDYIKYFATLSSKELLHIGKQLAATDYAVRFYNNKKHPKFYKNDSELLRTIRRTYTVGAFDHKERIEKMVIEFLEDGKGSIT